MGRVKLKIKKLENSGRHVTYSKRRSGILKKAKELSILCDIPLILLMFSPNGKPTICVGEHRFTYGPVSISIHAATKGAFSAGTTRLSLLWMGNGRVRDRERTVLSIEDVITKYAQHTPQERAKRKLESLEQPEFSQADWLTSYQSAFDHTNLLSDRLFKQDMELHDSAATAMNFGSHYDLPRPGDEANFQSWAPAACGATTYDQQHQQQPAQSHVQIMTKSLNFTAPSRSDGRSTLVQSSLATSSAHDLMIL
ncbi:hypothetical protein ABZP36_008640 [Zizania latifolia]